MPVFGRFSATVALGAVFTLALAGIASGSDGQALVLGHDNSATSTTSINGASATVGAPPSGTGLWANGSIGLFGSTSGFDVSPPDELVGVVGIGSDEGGYFTGVDSGLTAISGGDGDGVTAESAGSGAGVSAHGTIGVAASGSDTAISASSPKTAISAQGAVQFSTAGLATIAKGKTSITVNPGVAVTQTTKVLATLQSGGGTFQRVGRNAASGTITLFLSKAATAPVTVAYFVLS